MGDSRSTTFAVNFENGGAVTSLTDMEDALDAVEGMTDMLEDDLKGVTKGLADTGLEGDKAFKTLIGSAKDTSVTFEGTGDALVDSLSKGLNQVGSFGSAFKTAMGVALKHEESLVKGMQTGFKGFFAYSKNSLKSFGKDFADKAKSVGSAFAHPIQTIKGGLSDALLGVKKHLKGAGEEADKSGKEMREMGDKGSSAADKAKGAFGGMLKAMMGMQALKAAGNAIKSFAKNALDAAMADEEAAARFNATFKDETAAGWVDDFSKKIHRTSGEIQEVMVKNKGLWKEMGVTGDEEADKLSKTLTSVSYDMAKAFNTDEGALSDKMFAAIRGNAKALDEYGIALSDTVLKEEARKMGLKGELKDMDDATMAQVRLNAIMAQTQDTQGQAAKEATTLKGAMADMKGVVDEFIGNAGAKMAPIISKFANTLVGLWPKIEPGLMALVDVLAGGLGEALPVIGDLAEQLLPDLASVVRVIFDALQPVIPLIGPLIKTLLPPLVNILGVLAKELMPTAVDVIMALLPIVEALLPPVIEIVKVLLPPLMTLLKSILPILDVVAPILELVGELLVPIAEFLGKIIEWVAGGIGKVADFFSGLFGGAKKSKKEVAGLSGEMDALDGKTVETTVGVDSASVDALEGHLGDLDGTKIEASLSLDTSGADRAAQDTAKETVKQNKEIEKSSEKLNKSVEGQLKAVNDMSRTAYDAVGSHAEKAWARAAEAARVGTGKIVGYIGKVNGMGTVRVAVSDPLPRNAKGTGGFEGGWTHINEEGGEVAFLPQGTAILPADRSEQLMQTYHNEQSSKSAQKVTHNTFHITVSGDVPESTIRRLKEELLRAMEQARQEDQDDEDVRETVQFAFA